MIILEDQIPHTRTHYRKHKMKIRKKKKRKKATVEPLLTDTSIIRTSLYYGQLQLGSKDTTIHTIPTSLKTDTSIIRTLVSAPLVSVLKRSYCSRKRKKTKESSVCQYYTTESQKKCSVDKPAINIYQQELT